MKKIGDCMNYDVFISSKSEDYHLAEEVYNFLKTNGLSVFIASEELKKIGEAQYANAIDEVLDDSIHMIVVASSVYNIKSKWVKYEWSTFSNDLKSGYRDGNLLTILSGNIELKTLPASLRHQQSFNFRSYKDEILDYLNIDKRCEQHNIVKQNTSANIAVFKFYSNENCQIMLEGKLIANIIGMSDEPYCIPISRKGDYRFKCINTITAETQILKEHIDADEERDVDIHWKEHKPFIPDQEWPEQITIIGTTEGQRKPSQDTEKLYQEGKWYVDTFHDNDKAIKYLLQAAKADHKEAQNLLGLVLCKEKEYAQALKWFMRAAENGHPTSQYNIGKIYYKGLLGTIDFPNALKWFIGAAKRGSNEANNMLGVMYEEGKGVTQSYDTAYEYYLVAANAGNAAAQYNIGCLIEQNKITHYGLNKTDAFKWFELAAKQGDKDAEAKIKKLRQQKR